ncbi:MAG: hypothetical protein ACREQM_05585 [Candidatus Dormibacteraceae bacterium]
MSRNQTATAATTARSEAPDARREPIPPAPKRVLPKELGGIVEELRRRHRDEAAEQLADVRRRIEIGHQRVRQAEHDGRDKRPLIRRLSELETREIALEGQYEVPIFVMTVLADTLCGLEHKAPQGSLLRIRMPDIVDVTVEMSGVPF